MDGWRDEWIDAWNYMHGTQVFARTGHGGTSGDRGREAGGGKEREGKEREGKEREGKERKRMG
jgi:hypothetical protein